MSSLVCPLPFACALLGAALALLAPGDARAEGRKAERAAPAAKPRGDAAAAKPRGDAAAAKPRGDAAAASAGAESSSPAAPKQDLIETCLEDHARGQELRLGGKLLDARAAFLHCSATHCPNQIQRDCSGYLEQIQVQVPSVVLRVTADGVSRGDVKVFIDGRLALDQLTGKALELDPGPHQLRVVLPPYPPYMQSLIVSEGERFRVLEVAFAKPRPNAAPEEGRPERRLEMHRPIPVSAYIFGSVGTAALLSGVGWGVSTWSLKNELEAGCAPTCSEKSVDVLRQRALFADVSWGVGAASLIAAGVFYLIRPEVPLEVEDRVQVGVSWLKERGAVGTLSFSAF
jgi:hypothetical protein